MRIGIDARTILSPEKSDAIGSGHYTYQLIRHILDLDTKNEYVLFFDDRAREKDVKKFKKDNTKIVFYPFSEYKKYLPVAYSEVLGLATIQKERLDVLHSTSLESRIPIGYHGKTVVTFGNLAFFSAPDCYSRAKRESLKAKARYMSQKASKIIAVSNSVKDEIEKFLKVSGHKIEVIHNGVDERFFEIPETKKTRVLGKYGIEKKYIMFLGTVEPDKNIKRLIQAFSDFKKRQLKKNGKKNGKNFEYQLVIAGKKGWLFEEYVQTAKNLGVLDDIVFTGYVIGDELSALFRAADFFIAPCVCGGCGVGVLEALASGTPVIASHTPSFKEIAGNAAMFVNPLDMQSISEAMCSFCCDEDKIKEKLSQNGLVLSKKFNWKDTAKKTVELYESMM